MTTLMKIKNATKRFEALVAVNDVSFSIEDGETLGLIGPNGAGKTTLINVIGGTYSLDSGTILFKDKNITNFPSHKICEIGISRTYQIPRPFPELTALNNVIVSALSGKRRRDMSLEDAGYEATHYLEFVGLFSKRNILARDLNLYELRMLELARALATTPKLVFIDEVMAGLNPVESSRAVKLIKRAKEEFGLTIVWVEHVMKIIMEAADRIVVLHYGKKIAEGVPEEIASNKKVIDAYLGGESA